MFLPPNMAAMQTLLYTGSSKCPSLSWNGHKWQLSNPHTKPQILTSIRPIFTVRLSDAISYNTLPTRKKFQDFKTCFKACRQSCPEKCRKRVVRRLHSTKSYRVKSVFRQPQMFAQSPISEILTSGHNFYLQTSYKLGQLWSYNIQIDQASSMRVHRYFLFLQAVEFDSLIFQGYKNISW